MWAPLCDVSETKDDLVLSFELPGVNEKDIDVSLVGDQLTIKGEKRSAHEEKKDVEGHVVHRTERSYGAFQRTNQISTFDIRLSLGQALLGAAASLLGPCLVDLLGVFCCVCEDGHRVVKHFQEAARNEERFLSASEFDPQFTDFERRK